MSFWRCEKSVEFSYYYGNGKPDWLAQKVPLSVKPKELDKTVESFAWKFERLVAQNIVKSDRNISLIFQKPDQKNSRPVREAIAELETVSTVIDVGNSNVAADAFRRFIRTSKIH